MESVKTLPNASEQRTLRSYQHRLHIQREVRKEKHRAPWFISEAFPPRQYQGTEHILAFQCTYMSLGASDRHLFKEIKHLSAMESHMCFFFYKLQVNNLVIHNIFKVYTPFMLLLLLLSHFSRVRLCVTL